MNAPAPRPLTGLAPRLLLTHISDELDCGWAHERATESFGAPVEIAAHGAVYEI